MHAPRSGGAPEWGFKDLTLIFADDAEAGVTIEGLEKSGPIHCPGVKYTFEQGKVQFDTTETAPGGCLSKYFETKDKERYQVCCLLRNWSAVCPCCRLIHADEIRGG